jgi:LacI family transcriptional regulator, repressor for deo operon, udp, cdd, tsx, nupC, and nupG
MLTAEASVSRETWLTANLEDVAARARVSTATVSRALRGLPNVSDGTRERVRQAARDLDYVANRHASGLATGLTGSIGVVVPFLGTWFFSEALTGLEMALREAGRDLLLYSLGDASGRSRFFQGLPLRNRVDGVVVLTVPVIDDEAAAIESLAMPAVLLGAESPGLSTVRIDDVEGGRVAVSHLLNLGHRRIGFITGDESPTMHFTPQADRRVGYLAALSERGIPYDPQLEVQGNFSVEGGSAAMTVLLSLADPPTAVFTESDEMAMGALRTIRRMGLSVPQDISIVGFDDHALAELMDITTVAQPVRGLGVMAAEMLIDMLEGRQADPRQITVPIQLVVRGTTGPVRVSQPENT